MDAIKFINTLKPLLADYQATVDREAKAAADKVEALKIITLLFKELPKDQLAAMWGKKFTVYMSEGSVFEVMWGEGLRSVAQVSRLDTFKELLPQEGGADAT